MTAPRLATTRPAALTGRIGLGGDNRVHDVALVQALLGLKRDKRSRTYLRDNHVTGKLDRPTAEALMQFRLDHGDRNVKSPLARTGPIFNKLAQGQALAVLEGTALPYKLATLAEPGEAKGEAAKLLSAERQVALHEMMKDFISDWGIALDVEIKVATNDLPARSEASLLHESLPLVAQFSPRNLWVHNGRNLSSVPNSTQFQARAKALYEAAAADVKARCIAAFGITDAVDVRIQNGLKSQLACVVRTDLEGVEALAQFLLAIGRKVGPSVTVQFFENYLNMNKPFIRIGRDEILEFDWIANAAAENIERFENQTFISPTQSNPVFSDLEAMTANPTAKDIQVLDDWKADLNFKKAAGIRRFAVAGATDFKDTSLAYLAFGQSSLESNGVFDLKRSGDRVFVTGKVTHVFADADGYNFNPGNFFHPESQVLERHKKARPFSWEAEWTELIDGEIQIGRALPRGPVQGLRRQWIRFDTRPGP